MAVSSAIHWLRRMGLLEGISFLVLLFIAMPLKYMAGKPEAVKIAGWIHGILFILFCIALANAAWRGAWPFSRTIGFFIAGLLPFGPFVADRKLKSLEQGQA